jgi:hypothetical protein
VAFTFTDGDKGHMSREEMLTHVALHAGIIAVKWAACCGNSPSRRHGTPLQSIYTRPILIDANNPSYPGGFRTRRATESDINTASASLDHTLR